MKLLMIVLHVVPGCAAIVFVGPAMARGLAMWQPVVMLAVILGLFVFLARSNSRQLAEQLGDEPPPDRLTWQQRLEQRRAVRRALRAGTRPQRAVEQATESP